MPSLNTQGFARSIGHALDPSTLALDLGLELDPWQLKCLQSENERILLCCSRQAGKSTVAALRALHALMFDQAKSLILVISPSQRQSQELFRIIADMMRRLGVQDVVDETTLRLEMRNGSRCIALPASTATIRGLSAATLIVIDEAAYVGDELFTAIRPMLAVRRGRLMALSTPAGTQGFFYEQWRRGRGWDRYHVKCWDVPRLDSAWLEEERDLMGPLLFSREYEAEFMENDDALFTAAMIESALDDTIEPLILGMAA